MTAPYPEKKMDLTKVPLAFAEGATLKKAATWNQQKILEAGILVSPEVIAEFADIALYVPASLRIETSTADLQHLVEENIRKFKDRQKAERVQDLSQAYEAGETVFTQGDTEDQDCYFLIEGAFEVLIDGHPIATIEEPGQPLGEMSFLTGEARTATVRAAGPAKLLRVKKEDQKKILRKNPTIVHTLLESLVKRLGDTSRRFRHAQSEIRERSDLLAELQAEVATRAASAHPPREESAEKLKADRRAMAEYASREAGIKRGNRDLLRQLADGLTPADRGGGAYELLESYLAYLEAQPCSKAAAPLILDDLLPEELQRRLGGA